MSTWNKKYFAKETAYSIHTKYGVDLLTASIFARRRITEGSDILYFLENDKRFLHSPFLFNEMEDAVDRILDAKDEGEKVLIFGDRDVDGITSTALLFQYLKELGLDVKWQLPRLDDRFGLTNKVVDDFAAEYGTLIITVDCGIRCNEEIAHAADLGIDVIVVDHHNPQADLPEPAIIVNPCVENCGYPFNDISGCAVTFKLVSALRFAQNPLYKQEICLLNIHPINEAYVVDCIKTENLVIKNRLTETLVPGVISINQTKLVDFLKGQQIFVWDEPLQKKMISKIFGQNVEINMLDVRPEIGSLIPSIKDFSLLRLKTLSKIAKYQDSPSSEIEGFFNIFVTFVQKKMAETTKTNRENDDIQLVALAALADIMPLKNENRILVNQGLALINSGKIRKGLSEILLKQNMLGKKVSAKDLSWNIVPALNATGRLGEPETALNLLLEENSNERLKIAERILALNEERKKLSTEAVIIANKSANENLERFNNKIAYAKDEKINRGVTGLVAGKISSSFELPTIVVGCVPATETETKKYVCSARSPHSFNLMPLIEYCADTLLYYGGHDCAAGFTIDEKMIEPFEKKLEDYSASIEFSKNDEDFIEIDAELPPDYLTPDLLNLVDNFEPFGEQNPPLTFLAKNAKIISADIAGKTEKTHLRLTLDCGKFKWPAMFWNAGEMLNKDFSVGDKVDVVFEANRNVFNGKETPQMIIKDMKRI